MAIRAAHIATQPQDCTAIRARDRFEASRDFVRPLRGGNGHLGDRGNAASCSAEIVVKKLRRFDQHSGAARWPRVIAHVLTRAVIVTACCGSGALWTLTAPGTNRATGFVVLPGGGARFAPGALENSLGQVGDLFGVLTSEFSTVPTGPAAIFLIWERRRREERRPLTGGAGSLRSLVARLGLTYLAREW